MSEVHVLGACWVCACLVAWREPQFITVTCKIVEDSDKESHDLLLDLVKDEHSDDTTVSADIFKITNSNHKLSMIIIGSSNF